MDSPGGNFSCQVGRIQYSIGGLAVEAPGCCVLCCGSGRRRRHACNVHRLFNQSEPRLPLDGCFPDDRPGHTGLSVGALD